jgi:hypothetical protein
MVALLGTSPFKSKSRLEAENAALRHRLRVAAEEFPPTAARRSAYGGQVDDFGLPELYGKPKLSRG